MHVTHLELVAPVVAAVVVDAWSWTCMSFVFFLSFLAVAAVVIAAVGRRFCCCCFY